jgi:hypothetical protein
VRNITYDISDLNNFLDSLQDVCALVWVNCSPVCIYNLFRHLDFLHDCCTYVHVLSIASTLQTTSTSLMIEPGWRRRYYSISRGMLVLVGKWWWSSQQQQHLCSVSYDVMCPRAYVYLAINHDVVNYYVSHTLY